MEKDIWQLRPAGFEINEQFKVIYGRVNGINVMLEPYKTVNTHYLTFRMDLSDEDKREELLSYLRTLENQYSYITYAGWNHKFMIYLSFHTSEDEDLLHINILIDKVTEKCNELGLYNCCENCKRRGDFRFVDISGDKYQMCSSCAEKFKDSLQNFNQKHEKVILGIIGGIIGAMLGSLLWILLDQIHFIAGIAGYAIVFCSFKGYIKLGGRISKKGVVACIIVCIFTILGADLFSFALDIYREFAGSYNITFSQAILSVPLFLTEKRILGRILLNLGLGYLIAFIGCYSFVEGVWKTTEKKQTKEIHYI